ncbi:MAG: preprotein translocase subunit SecG [Dongiaceae bacterium]
MAIILVIHVLIALALVTVILLQKKEAGIGGLGGGSGGLGGLMSGRAKADTLSKTTGILATAFFVTSLALAIIGSRTNNHGPLVPATSGTTAPVTAPASGTAPAGAPESGNTAPVENAPAQPATPAVPAGD